MAPSSESSEKLLREVGRVSVVDSHPIPGRGEGQSGGPADTAGSPRDQHRARAGHRVAVHQFRGEAVTQEVYFGRNQWSLGGTRLPVAHGRAGIL